MSCTAKYSLAIVVVAVAAAAAAVVVAVAIRSSSQHWGRVTHADLVVEQNSSTNSVWSLSALWGQKRLCIHEDDAEERLEEAPVPARRAATLQRQAALPPVLLLLKVLFRELLGRCLDQADELKAGCLLHLE
jgi:hypothetical protein